MFFYFLAYIFVWYYFISKGIKLNAPPYGNLVSAITAKRSVMSGRNQMVKHIKNGQQPSSNKHLNQELWDNVLAIDLTQIYLQLIHRKGFTQEIANQSIAKYRQYLYLSGSKQFGALTPDKLTDEVWHAHILHMEKYENDCIKTFGFVIKHVPTPIDPDTPLPLNIVKHSFEEMVAQADCSGSTCSDGYCSGGCSDGGAGYAKIDICLSKASQLVFEN